MGDVAGLRRRGSDEDAQAVEAFGTPGKTTRSGAVQRKVADAGGAQRDEAHGEEREDGDGGESTRRDLAAVLGYLPDEADAGGADVEAIANDTLVGAFGGVAGDTTWTVGGGEAEAHGANAITKGGNVDFAPGQFDPASLEGKARIGEEAAHAQQQRTDGPPAQVEALEAEAKQAGMDFARGETPVVTLAAAPETALADDTKTPPPKDTDPSKEVPHLRHGEVTAIKAKLGDPAKALALLLAAVTRLDANHAKNLVGGKLHPGGGTTKTGQGAKFKAWWGKHLEAESKALGKKPSELSSDQVAKIANAAKPPDADLDIKIEIDSGHFKSVSLLYSTVRHELEHAAQIRAAPMAWIASSLMPKGVASPSKDKVMYRREMEAYLLEMEILDGSGLLDPGELHLLWDKCTAAWAGVDDFDKRTLQARFEKGVLKGWNVAMGAYIGYFNAQHAAWVSKQAVDKARVKSLQGRFVEMWNRRNDFGSNPGATSFAALQELALARSEEIVGNSPMVAYDKEHAEGEALKKADSKELGKVKAGWKELLAAFGALRDGQRATAKTKFEGLVAWLFERAFSLAEAEALKQIGLKKRGKAVDAYNVLIELMARFDESKVANRTLFDGRALTIEKGIAGLP